jgi:hypothetical protein
MYILFKLIAHDSCLKDIFSKSRTRDNFQSALLLAHKCYIRFRETGTTFCSIIFTVSEQNVYFDPDLRTN